MVESIIDTILPIIISILEMMGILIITIGSFRAFYHYVRALLTKDAYPVKHQFANSMATGLEFKLAAEILKTVTIKSMDELVILASVFIIRIIMTFVLEKEMKIEKKKEDTSH